MAKILKNSTLILLAIIIIAGVLRLYKLTVNPVSLFGDELDLGYQAYSILKTGKDYTGNPWPLHFHSLAEWRTPLYLYSAVPTVWLYGITPLGVRLPAAIFGILGVLGMYLMVKELLSYNAPKVSFHPRALLASFLLAISPWHLQYSRAGFEVTQLLAFLIFGLYFFFRALRLKGKGLWISVALFCFTPWIYSTAKLFTPLLLIFLFINWRKEIFSFPMRRLIRSVLIALIVGVPVAYSTFFSGGVQRAGYISVFTDPTVVTDVGADRTHDLLMRGNAILGSKPSKTDRLYHNKFTFWWEDISSNYLQSLSLNFLFSRGDPNLRHSIKDMGEFYKIDAIIFIFGIILFFTGKTDKKIKQLVAFWILAGLIPAAVTRDGGNHATRLILILPPLILLLGYALVVVFRNLTGIYKYVFLLAYTGLLLVNFIYYVHNYYVHYPWDSERWWHSGFKEAVYTIKDLDKDYDRVILSMRGEPAWIFFAGWYQYPPDKWQSEFPIGNDAYLKGFGNISHTGKYYFGNFNVEGQGIYDLGRYIDQKTLYLAVANEIGANLIMEPERTPHDLKLIKAIAYPSGEPAFYLFTKNPPGK